MEGTRDVPEENYIRIRFGYTYARQDGVNSIRILHPMALGYYLCHCDYRLFINNKYLIGFTDLMKIHREKIKTFYTSFEKKKERKKRK